MPADGDIPSPAGGRRLLLEHPPGRVKRWWLRRRAGRRGLFLVQPGEAGPARSASVERLTARGSLGEARFIIWPEMCKLQGISVAPAARRSGLAETLAVVGHRSLAPELPMVLGGTFTAAGAPWVRAMLDRHPEWTADQPPLSQDEWAEFDARAIDARPGEACDPSGWLRSTGRW